ncbi:MAG TPA: GWxTD domain-containing protein, partial [Thermoanaerobaculia bacterium]
MAVALTFAFTATILAQDATPPAAPTTATSDGVRKLSKRERKERTSHLDERHREFVTNVAPIILPAELDLFLTLEKAEERDTFVDEFWRRRDHMNHTSGVFKEMYARRLEVAKEQFKRIDSDRARMFLLHGPPQDVVRSNCHRVIQPIEIWKYQQLAGVGNNVRMLFYKPRNQGDYRLWNPLGGAAALGELVASNDAVSAEEGSARRSRETAATAAASPYAYINRIQLECAEGNEIMLAVTQMIQARVDLLKLFNPPQLEDETVQKIMRSVVVANPNAAKLATEASVRFPAKDGSRTDMQLMLLIPRAQLSPAAAGGVE